MISWYRRAWTTATYRSAAMATRQYPDADVVNKTNAYRNTQANLFIPIVSSTTQKYSNDKLYRVTIPTPMSASDRFRMNVREISVDVSEREQQASSWKSTLSIKGSMPEAKKMFVLVGNLGAPFPKYLPYTSQFLCLLHCKDLNIIGLTRSYSSISLY